MISQIVKQESQKAESLHINAAFMGTQQSTGILKELPSSFSTNSFTTIQELHDFLNDQSILTLPDIILIEIDPKGQCFDFVKTIKANPLWRGLIIIMIGSTKYKEWKSKALKLKVHDYYTLPFPIDHLLERINFLVRFKLIKPQLSVLGETDVTYRIPPGKKIFDIIVSFVGLLITSPLLVLTAILIKLDSPGPVIYKSQRVGTGYNIFEFYKFRSMRKDADSQLDDLADLNRYSNGPASQSKTAFIKLRNDPRVTRIGKFIRRTSIDELPQLFNVLKGDMSLVGNRPLPLYEAERLTSNEWALRFMGPAGLTGLWQIKSRGKRNISERDRKKFDNFYASKHSFWFDLEILIRTIPVILNKKNINIW